MRRLSVVVMAVVMLCGMALAASLGSGAGAQEGTPPAGPPDAFEIAPGVTAHDAVFAEGQQNPPIYRLSFEPGTTYEIAPGENLELVYVDVGHLVMRLEVPVTVSQLGTPDAPGETVPAGTEFTVSVGEYFVLPPGVGGEVRNEGLDTATVSVAGVAADISATPGAATPTG